MKAMRSGYFLSGEFAKLCGVPKKTLLYYDVQGLFRPEIIMDNGYRYYSLQQLESFQMIRTLKKIGMPLKEIQSYMKKRSPEHLLDLLISQQQVMEEQQKRLEYMQEVIKNKISFLQSARKLDLKQISLQYFPPQVLILSRPIEEVPESSVTEAVMEHIRYCDQHWLDAGYALGAMVHTKQLRMHKFSNRSYFFTQTFYDERTQKVPPELRFEKPGGQYAVVYFSGHYDNTEEAYGRLMDFLAGRNLDIEGYAYEESILEDLCAKSVEDYITRISVKIQEKTGG